MAVEDRIMRDMLGNEDLDRMVEKYQEGGIVPMPEEPLVPGMAAAAEAAGDRWGVDTPMFSSRDDMHAFLQDLGMVPGAFGADFLDSALYMTEGEFGDAMISLGAAVPAVGGLFTSWRKGKKGFDYAGRAKRTKEAHSGFKIDPTTGKKVRTGVRERNRVAKFKEDLVEKQKVYDREHVDLSVKHKIARHKANVREKEIREGMISKRGVAMTEALNQEMKEFPYGRIHPKARKGDILQKNWERFNELGEYGKKGRVKK